ncbi:hypothetical protein [Dactylosporangium sp. CA-233914]
MRLRIRALNGMTALTFSMAAPRSSGATASGISLSLIDQVRRLRS